MFKFVRVTKNECYSKNGIWIQFNRNIRGKWYECFSDFTFYTWENIYIVYRLLWNLFTTLLYGILVFLFVHWLKWQVSETLALLLIVMLIIPLSQFGKE